VKYERNESEQQKHVNQSARHVHDAEAANPRDQKNYKQYCPDTHISSSIGFRMSRIVAKLLGSGGKRYIWLLDTPRFLCLI
jgi:hypothetical protein